MAEERKSNKKDEMLLWGAGIGGVVLLYVVLSQRQGSTAPPTKQMSSHPTTMPNPQQASVDEAFAQARAQAIAMFDSTVLGEQTARDQLIATNNETQAQKLIAFNQDSTNYKIAGLQTSAAESIASTQASSAEQIAQQQSQAYQSSQPQWYDYLLSGLGSIGAALGFNNPYLNPVGYGTGYVDTGTGLPMTGPNATDIIPPITIPQLPSIWPGGGPTING